jgi:hypothetical protein
MWLKQQRMLYYYDRVENLGRRYWLIARVGRLPFAGLLHLNEVLNSSCQASLAGATIAK